LKPREIVEAFVEAINSGDAEKLGDLMTEDHVFIDADGSRHPGRGEMIAGWNKYYAMVPDFHIEVAEIYARGNRVMLAGTAEGTFSLDGELRPENHWRVAAAWRAETKGDLVAVWQLYVNPVSMLEILDRMKSN
jgi:uncharacterized protein (TIGR02246 family)